MVYSPEKHGTVHDFEKSDAYTQFHQEMSATLAHLNEFAAEHAPYDAKDIETRVDTFKERLFNLERNYYSTQRVAFYGEGKRVFDLLHRLLQNDDIDLHLRTSAVRNVAGELGVCGPGMITKLITEIDRLCNTNCGLLAASWQLKHDIIEQCISDYVCKHRIYGPGNEVHEVSAFMNYGAERLGISSPPDPFAPRDVAPEQLEACMKVVEDYVSPSRLALAMADRYQQIYLDRLSEETKIAPDQLICGVEYDDAIVKTANRLARELASTYGADTVKEGSASILVFDDAGGNEIVRVPTDPTLLARDILRAQHEAGLVEAVYKEGELVLDWNEPGTGLKVEIRHNDESLVWTTVGGLVEPLTVAHLTQFSKPELETRQAQQPKLTAALRHAVLEHEPAEALMNLPPQWLPPESCAPFLSKLSDDQAIAYLKANGSDLTPKQQRAFATAVGNQQRLPLLDHVGSWCVGSPPAQLAMVLWLSEVLSTGNAQAVALIGTHLLHAVADTIYGSLAHEKVLYNLLSVNGPGTLLYRAMDAGHDKAVQAFLDLVLTSGGAAKRFSPTHIANLLSAKSKNGASGLDRARENGHVDVVKTYLQAVMNAYWDKRISPEQCVELGVDTAHLAQFPKQKLETLQSQQPKLMAALGRAVIERESAEALMTLPLRWLPPECYALFLSKLNDQQARNYFEAVIERESAEALMTLPLRWLPPECCALFLSKLNDQQARNYFEASRSDLTTAQNDEFMKAIYKQRRPLDLLMFFVKGPPTTG
ncbi:hypothetical protein ACPUER_35700 [Burkholderia sp. DN3021]|uniref:hypothetical protein n=1 Tax=Burkholderia sp. DN3021 TaxID=3410137 RepID=UPI003C7D5C24